MFILHKLNRGRNIWLKTIKWLIHFCLSNSLNSIHNIVIESELIWTFLSGYNAYNATLPQNAIPNNVEFICRLLSKCRLDMWLKVLVWRTTGTWDLEKTSDLAKGVVCQGIATKGMMDSRGQKVESVLLVQYEFPETCWQVSPQFSSPLCSCGPQYYRGNWCSRRAWCRKLPRKLFMSNHTMLKWTASYKWEECTEQ